MSHSRSVALGLAICALIAPVGAQEEVVLSEPDPELGGIAMAMSIARMNVNKPKVRHVYFAKLGADGDLIVDEVVASNFFDKGQQYLLNVKPGRYVAVGATVEEQETTNTLTIGSDGSTTPMMTVGDENTYSVVFSDELIASTEVTVEAGRIVFLGRFKTKDRLALPDRLQLHYLPFLDPPVTESNGADSAEVPTLLLKKVERETDDAYKFWKKARNWVFMRYPLWLGIVRAEGARVER